MTERFTDWKAAHVAAARKARAAGLDVAIRRTREYGRTGFNISYASRSDSDYALAEIVRPGDPE